jgi:hypothetical protein
MASQLAEELSFCHSEGSLRSEDLGPIARLLCGETLFSWVLAKKRFLASLGVTLRVRLTLAPSYVKVTPCSFPCYPIKSV